MVVDGTMLASELRRRRGAPRSLAASVDGVTSSTWVLGDLRSAPTDLLVLAALSLTGGGGGGPPRYAPPVPAPQDAGDALAAQDPGEALVAATDPQ
ncbi:MAG: hypothetical protein ACR2HY_11420, partial [Acidimicrobiales bacterium]